MRRRWILWFAVAQHLGWGAVLLVSAAPMKITAIAGVPMNTTWDVTGVVSHFKAGDRVNIRFFRNGKSNELLVKVW